MIVEIPDGIVIYLDKHMKPVDEDKAVMIKILYNDGRIVFGVKE